MDQTPTITILKPGPFISEDGKSITLTSARPLSTGSYRVDWVIVGADTHRITGTHAFSVR